MSKLATAEDLRIMHQQPPKPHQDISIVELESAGPSGKLHSLEVNPRTPRPGSIVGRLPQRSSTLDPSPLRHSTLDPAIPRQSKLLLEPGTHSQPKQHQQSDELEAPGQQAAPRASVVRFPQAEQQTSAEQVQQSVQQSQTQPSWSASAHVQAVELLLQAAQSTHGSAQIALQHLQSIAMLCQACMSTLSEAEGKSKAVAPLQSMQSMCSSATLLSMQQPHAQDAMWLSLRLLCQQVGDILKARS